ncbi:MAG: phosphoglycerate dehydrogenase [Actinobacteria bacterium]|nr:MAG: phosphoglycerate dehydrogenase [Actinomycetota bacterium]
MKVLVADKISDTGIQKLIDAGLDVDVKTGLAEDEIVAIIADYDAMVVRSATKATRPIIEAAAKLKIIGRAGVGVDNVDVVAATERGIVVCNAPTSNIVSAAEQTITLMLASARNTPQANASMHAGKWERSKFTGTEVYEKTLGVVGLGRIGTLVAERARGLGMKLVGYDPYISEERAAALGVELVATIDEMLPKVDFLTVHLPKTKETIGMFGAEQFAKMRTGVRLINTARGGIYQEEALVAALKSGKVASAAIDVFEVEPCTESALHAIENVILTPHLGASTDEAQDRAGDQIAELVIAGLNGDMVPTAVNIAPVAPDVMEKVGPFITLAEGLGAAVAQFARAGIDELDVLTVGQLADTDTRILKTAVLKGLLGRVSDEPVNFVNANYYAEQRGLKVTETKRAETHDYTNMLIVRAATASGPVEIAATLIGKANEPRLVSLFGYDLDMAPGEFMAFFRYPDRPGMIGKVGTILGDEGINIASMQVGRTAAGGTALMGLVVDTALSEEILARIKATAEMTDAWSIEL